MNSNPKITTEQIRLVKQSWSKVVPIADIASSMFYKQLFYINPEIHAMFDDTDMDAQRDKLIKAINTVVMSLDRIETLIPMISELGKRHVGYGVRDEHYDNVAEALLWTLETGLGEDWNEEVKAAWTNAYLLLAEVMINGGSEQNLSAA